MIPWWCGSYPEAWEKIVDNWFMEGYARRTMLQGNGVWRCKDQHTIKAAATSPDTETHGYTNSFIYSDAQL